MIDMQVQWRKHHILALGTVKKYVMHIIIGKVIDMIREDSNGCQWMLVDSKHQPVSRGDVITNSRGEKTVIDSAEAPRHSGSTGRVNNFFPGVFGLQWKVLF